MTYQHLSQLSKEVRTRWTSGRLGRYPRTLGFGRFGADILIGNFGNAGYFAGWINAFDGHRESHELRNKKGQPISIDGLWSLVFGTFRNSDGDTMYFTAGPKNQTNGLFGKITPAP
jgi:hypothetical protein